jgi:hypothetical protein
MIHNIQSNTAKFFIINVNLEGNMFRLFLEMPKHAAFLINVNNKGFGYVRQNIVYYLYMYVLAVEVQYR